MTPSMDLGSDWDVPLAGDTMPLAGSDGVLDATRAPFLADPTGLSDSTQAIQRAAEFARDFGLIVWLPAGNYTITDTLNLTQTARCSASGACGFNASTNYCWSRFVPFVLRGPANDPLGRRARLILPPSTPLFTNASSPRYLVHFTTINTNGQVQENIDMVRSRR